MAMQQAASQTRHRSRVAQPHDGRGLVSRQGTAPRARASVAVYAPGGAPMQPSPAQSMHQGTVAALSQPAGSGAGQAVAQQQPQSQGIQHAQEQQSSPVHQQPFVNLGEQLWQEMRRQWIQGGPTFTATTGRPPPARHAHSTLTIDMLEHSQMEPLSVPAPLTDVVGLYVDYWQENDGF